MTTTTTTINSARALRAAALEAGWKAGYEAAAYWWMYDKQPGNLFAEFLNYEAHANWFGLRGRGAAWLAGFWRGVEDFNFPTR